MRIYRINKSYYIATLKITGQFGGYLLRGTSYQDILSQMVEKLKEYKNSKGELLAI